MKWRKRKKISSVIVQRRDSTERMHRHHIFLCQTSYLHVRRALHLALSVYPGYVLVYSLKCGGGKQELQQRRKVEISVASLKIGSWQNEEMNTRFRPYQTNGQLSLTAAVFLWGWECLGEFIYVATTDHYLALWKERKSIRQPHKNHLNTSRILRGRPSGKKPKSSWHDSPFLLLPPLLIVLSFFFSVRRAQVWGHGVSARECQLIKASLTGDSLLWRCRNLPSTPGETRDMVTLLVYLQRLQPFLLAKKKKRGGQTLARQLNRI